MGSEPAAWCSRLSPVGSPGQWLGVSPRKGRDAGGWGGLEGRGGLDLLPGTRRVSASGLTALGVVGLGILPEAIEVRRLGRVEFVLLFNEINHL